MGSRMYVTQHGAVPATWSYPGVGIVACSCHEPRASSSVKSLLDTLPAATAASSLGPQSGKKWLMPALLSLSPSRCKGCLQAHTTSCYHTALEASAVPHMLRSSGIAQVDMNGSKTLSVSFGYISVREKKPSMLAVSNAFGLSVFTEGSTVTSIPSTPQIRSPKRALLHAEQSCLGLDASSQLKATCAQHSSTSFPTFRSYGRASTWVKTKFRSCTFENYASH